MGAFSSLLRHKAVQIWKRQRTVIKLIIRFYCVRVGGRSDEISTVAFVRKITIRIERLRAGNIARNVQIKRVMLKNYTKISFKAKYLKIFFFVSFRRNVPILL